MFLRKAALRPVPGWAVVDEHALETVEQELEEREQALQDTLDTSFRELDRRQPVLAAYMAEQVADLGDELVQSLGYFLTVTVYMAFREAFPRRLSEVDDSGLRISIDTLAVDEELRRNDPSEVLESDDVVAMGQPAVLAFVQHHIAEALDQSDGDIDLSDLDRLHRAVLVEVIALSHAVNSPSGEVGPPREALA